MGWYGVHAMDRSGSLREDNAESIVCRCASSRSGLGVEVVAPKSKAFCASLSALTVVDYSAEFRWRREECGEIAGL